MKCIEVVFNLPIDNSFHYLVPSCLEASIEVGKRVKAPFGPKELIGFIAGLSTKPSGRPGLRLKEIIEVVDKTPLLSDRLMRLARWMSEYYLCPLGETIGAFIPPGINTSKPKNTTSKIKTDLSTSALTNVNSSKPLLPTSHQKEVLERVREAIGRGGYTSFLLYGITGSGKTEVYLQAIEEVIRGGKGAIVLIPEISLTKQTLERFSDRFPGKVAVLHSGLTLSQRSREWRRIREGRVHIVIGARSAIFAPMEKVGLIVVDEEHETSFKQDETSPRYQGRDVAVMRAKIEDAVIILGSATPSLESYYNTRNGKSSLLYLPERMEGRSLPPVEMVDMRKETGASGILSRALRNGIETVLKRKEQAILFLNRRGYSNFLLCRGCGLIMDCPHCSVSLTYHLKEKTLRCHYCNYTQSAPSCCPKCSGTKISRFGFGTQRVEEEIGRFFPHARVIRMDRDTTRKRGSHEAILSKFEVGEADILLGTQMVAKGFDFSRVTLVGIISADVALNLPDFRAGERTFNLLTQVAGRTGRGSKGGVVIIQTYNPDHYSILMAKDHDYESFYQQEVAFRRELGYPPFNHLLNLKLEGRNEETVMKVADDLCCSLRIRNEFGYQILGPAPCTLSKIRGRYRWQILVKGKKPSSLRTLVQEALLSLSIPSQLRLIVDMDPVMML